MKCSECGKEFPEGVKFCDKCGKELTASAEPATEETKQEAAVEAPVNETKEAAGEPKKEVDKPKMDLKKILIPVAAVAAVIVLIVLISSLFGGKAAYKTYGKDIVTGTILQDDTLYVSYSNGEYKDMQVTPTNTVFLSGDRKVVVFCDDSDELTFIKNGKVVGTGYDETKSITVSYDGSTIAYLTDVKNGSGTLNLYDTKSKKAKEIADDVRVGSLVLSPDGKTVAYVGDYDAEDDFKGYYSVNGKSPVEVGKEKKVFAIANKGAYVYYKDGDRIYVQKGKKDAEKLASDCYSFRAYFNEDLSQIMYTYDGKTYVSDNAKEKVKLSGDTAYSIVLPQDALTYQYSKADGDIYMTGVKSLEKQLVALGESIYYIKPGFETLKIASNIYEYQYVVSADFKKLYYIGSKRDVIMVTDFAKGGKKTDMTSDGDAVGFVTDVNLKKLYVLNSDDELRYVKSKKKSEKLSDDVTSYVCSKDGATCYFAVDGETLYFSKNGGKKEKLMEADDRVRCYSSYGSVRVIVTEDDSRTYYVADGKKLKEIFSED